MHFCQHVNKEPERPRYRYFSFLGVPFTALLTLTVVVQPALAFPTPVSPDLSRSIKRGSHLTFRRHGLPSRDSCSFYPGFKVLSKGYQSMRYAVLRTKPTDQEQFQRSLLEAKLVNDVITTNAKEEKRRNEVVAEKIDQEKEELQIAMKEVKEAVQEVSQSAVNLRGAVISNSTVMKVAVQEVSQSAKNLGGAFITKAPRIFSRLLKLRATGEMRWGCLLLTDCTANSNGSNFSILTFVFLNPIEMTSCAGASIICPIGLLLLRRKDRSFLQYSFYTLLAWCVSSVDKVQP